MSCMFVGMVSSSMSILRFYQQTKKRRKRQMLNIIGVHMLSSTLTNWVSRQGHSLTMQALQKLTDSLSLLTAQEVLEQFAAGLREDSPGK